MGASSILVIDDEKLIVKTTCILLRHMGFRTMEAYTGAEGEALARREKPDLILLDLVLPDGDGWGVLERLKASEETAGIPVVIFTAKEYAHAETVNPLRGATGLIGKPFEPGDLEEVIGKLGLVRDSGGP